MILYSFKTEDGEVVEKRFPMGECPKEITLDDGRTAKRTFGMPYVSMYDTHGHVTGDGARKLNSSMRKQQKEAGDRMKDNWESAIN